MIEFKADCGHTVRAKDQDAGKAVRCSYCGDTVSVPEEQADELDFFFNEVDRAADGAGDSKASSAGGARKRARKRKPKREFDPFALALKMCYAAVVIITVWVGGKMFVLPWWSGTQREQTVQRSSDDVRRDLKKRNLRGRAASSSRRGLASLTGDWGLYVGSVPAGARVFIALSSDVKKNQRVSDVAGCRTGTANMMLGPGQLPAGTYTVEVRHLWNDPQLKAFPEYRAFRRGMEDAGSKGRKRANEEADRATARRNLMVAYFLPDEASNVLIDQGHDSEYYLVREYTNVEVREGQWAEVRALFLPRIGGVANDDGSFSLERVRGHIPQGANYSFDDSFVKDELEYYGVAPTDVQFALDVLKWQGLVPYQTPDRGLRMFKIRIADGAFIAADIKDLLLP